MTKSFKKQLPTNLISNLIVFLLSTLIGLFMTPFLIKYTGIDGFGVIRLALAIPVFVGLSTLIISGAISRFLSIDLQKKDFKSANETFNTALFGIFFILCILLPIIIIFSYRISDIFTIPHKFEQDAIYLFFGILLSALITIFSSIFTIPAFANNRLDINNYSRIGTLIIQTAMMIALIVSYSFPLSAVGLAHVVGALFGLAVSLRIWKRFAPDLKLHLRSFKVSKLKEIGSMGTFIFIDQIGTILFLYIDLVIINYVFGAEATGEYSIPLQWQTMLRTLAVVLAGVITPMIFISFAKGDIVRIKQLSLLSVKFLGLAMAIPIGLIMGFAPTLLELWVGEKYIVLTPLFWLIVGPLAINMAFLGLYSVSNAYNKVKMPAYVALATGVLNLILALLFTVILNFGLYGIALAAAITFSARNLLFTTFYIANIVGTQPLEYYRNLLYGIIVTVILFTAAYGLQELIAIESWAELLLWFIGFTFGILPFIWYVMVAKEEKEILIDTFLREGLIARLKGSSNE